MFFADEEDRDSNDLSQVIGRWSKSGWFRARNRGEAWSPRLILYRLVAARRRRDTGKKGVLPVRMQTIVDGGRNRCFFAKRRIVSFRTSSCRGKSKVGVKHIYHASVTMFKINLNLASHLIYILRYNLAEKTILALIPPDRK